jgi:hypothetical protein
MSSTLVTLNKNKINTLFSTICIIFLSACSQPTKTDSTPENFQKETDEAPQAQVERQSTLPKISDQEIEARFPSKPISKMINGVKMTAKVLPVTRGSMVFDNSVKENAMVKGNVVVVLKENTDFPADWREVYKVSELTSGVYSLEPDGNEDMLNHYEKLKNHQSVSRVELGLFYGPDDGPEIM